jgi:predicted P-loop ATPase
LDNVALKVCQVVLARFQFDPGHTFTFDALKIICLDRVFDPVRDYLDGLRWDGVPRLDTWLIKYGGADDTPLNRAIGRKMLVAAVRRVRVPGCKFDYIVVLESEEQGIGKSTMLRLLACDENFSDAEIIGQDKQDQQEYSGHLDLRDRRTGRHAKEWKPEADIRMIDLAGIKRDRDQLWAEGAAIEAAGEPLVIPEKLWPAAKVQQQARMEIDAWVDVLGAG